MGSEWSAKMEGSHMTTRPVSGNLIEGGQTPFFASNTSNRPPWPGPCSVSSTKDILWMLQADERSIHRVVYESLCWIEEKKIDIKTFFDYTFQKCFLDLYRKLNDISQQIQAQDDPVNKCPTNTKELELILSRGKTSISNIIKERFPFMNGLQDRGILTELELLELQADESTTTNVVYKTLNLIEKKKNLIPYFFAYLSQDIYLEKYPKLKNIFQSLLQNETTAQRLGNRISKEPDFDESGVKDILPGMGEGQDYRETTPAQRLGNKISKQPDIYESEDVSNEYAHSTSNLDDTTAQRLGNGISKVPDINESGVEGALPGIDQGQDYRGKEI
ncbi:nuclear autoantigen Sp-100 isoform X12 [Pelobates cultripes]|uniref:Nuclear autoantigen Sp-100 isoform X12 n=1 Tax=Pelobates cultripes TaxID=61616 RepID=A0AAD1SE76_PELCU|nr:nuclear autoantigen Sp-100 isoform X12 [Pelobates cultripes]